MGNDHKVHYSLGGGEHVYSPHELDLLQYIWAISKKDTAPPKRQENNKRRCVQKRRNLAPHHRQIKIWKTAPPRCGPGV